MVDRKDYKIDGKCTADNCAKQRNCIRSMVFGMAECNFVNGHDCTSEAIIKYTYDEALENAVTLLKAKKGDMLSIDMSSIRVWWHDDNGDRCTSDFTYHRDKN